MEKAQVYAKYKYARISSKKVVPVLNLVRGKRVDEAKRILKFDQTKGAKIALKVLTSAIANAKTAHDLGEDKLYISEIRADGGPMFKRGRFVGRGHFSPILKRTSHITVGLSPIGSNTAKGGKK